MSEQLQRGIRGGWIAASVAVMALLAACGGGGGSAPAAATTPPPLLPTLSVDTTPAGARVDVSTRNFFPLAVNDTWTYDRRSGSTGAVTGPVTRSVVSGPDANGYFRLEEVDGPGTVFTLYRLVSAGLEMRDPFGAEGAFPGVYQALPSIVEYPTPFYAAGGLRSVLRQGSLGVDVDGDAKPDYYTAEMRQIFRGFEMMSVLGQSIEVAHFSNTLYFLALGSRLGNSYAVTASEETYFASNLGLVRAERSAVGSDGAVINPAYAIELKSATVGGQVFSVAAPAAGL